MEIKKILLKTVFTNVYNIDSKSPNGASTVASTTTTTAATSPNFASPKQRVENLSFGVDRLLAKSSFVEKSKIFLKSYHHIFAFYFRSETTLGAPIMAQVVVGLCSELFMSLSFYKMESTVGIEPMPV